MTIKTAVQYTILVDGELVMNKELSGSYQTDNFREVKGEVIRFRRVWEGIKRVEVARITVIEGV